MSFHISPASRLEVVKEYYFSTKLKQIAALKASGIPVLNLGIGSPDLAPSDATIQALVESAQKKENHAYQAYQGIPALRTAFANFYQKHYQVNLDPNGEILPLIGSKEGIMHIAMAYLEKGDITLIPNPGYPTYQAACALTGAEVQSYELTEANGWLPDLVELAKRDLSRVKIMWVNYPHMPTGAQANVAFFEKLRDFALTHSILLVNDNPYSFILNQHPNSMLSIPGMKEVAIELNSLSKSHNMAGWRIGAVLGQQKFLAPILTFKSNMDSGMFLPLQEAAVKALESNEVWFAQQNKIYAARQKVVFQLMDLLECSYDPNQSGMFVWAKVPSKYKDGYELSDKILDENAVFITPGGIFGSQGNAYIRISLCAPISLFETAIQRIKTQSNGI
ncbi:pyridoxal phosphate-dependent aminotransferase [Aquirufa rosea]|uniref:Aminotransferase n=1 Tax=Aquirufa rosea TaxID=2509241 RepID=A0A4Q1C1A7_9BACT|nr:aminotransferase class I/II-fold pyridoxal phosphate-dependent enzyme [Aquirufa rosea]RXK50820.1 aminotransferase class I/II-fold pyridoxal phosphate-dependent enzyme [Aquirufa rosea]